MKTTKVIIFLLGGFMLLSSSCTQDKSLRGIAENLRVENDVPGMAIALVKADTILEMFTLGYRRSGHDEKIQVEDRFHIGSNTKSKSNYSR